MTSFTHVDPFEDTERSRHNSCLHSAGLVSPTSIRSRILKGNHLPIGIERLQCFTHVDPFEDTESLHGVLSRAFQVTCFTHVDPFEDTESAEEIIIDFCVCRVSPTSIRSRILKVADAMDSMIAKIVWFHPRRSVRGY